MPDIIFLDPMMYEIKGLELCKIIKENSGYSGIPIVDISPDKRSKISGHIGTIKTSHRLMKPFSPVELLAIVSELSGNHNK